MIKELEHQNALMEKLRLKYPQITPIESEDFSLFKTFFVKDKPSYGNSWTYITQGLYGTGEYNLGYKFFDRNNLVALSINPKIDSPNINVLYWVRPQGKRILDIINEISLYVKETYKIPIFVKKINIKQKRYLLDLGFNDISDYPWHKLIPSEDDSLPERIIDLKLFNESLSNGTASKRLKRIIEKVNNFKLYHNIRLENLDKNNNQIAYSIVYNFFDYLKTKKNRYMVSSPKDYINPIFVPPIEGRIGKVVYVDGIPLGFFICEEINKDFCGLYALITLRNKYPILNVLAMFEAINQAHKHSFKFINLGGSEYKGVDDAKLKFSPSLSNQMYWVTLK